MWFLIKSFKCGLWYWTDLILSIWVYIAVCYRWHCSRDTAEVKENVLEFVNSLLSSSIMEDKESLHRKAETGKKHQGLIGWIHWFCTAVWKYSYICATFVLGQHTATFPKEDDSKWQDILTFTHELIIHSSLCLTQLSSGSMEPDSSCDVKCLLISKKPGGSNETLFTGCTGMSSGLQDLLSLVLIFYHFY